MRVLVCGGRDFGIGDDVARLRQYDVLSSLNERRRFTAVIEGGAPGADAGGAAFGQQQSIPVITFKADWSRGKKAGPERNARMLAEGRPDLVVAFAGGRGTADMVSKARAAGVRVVEVA